MSVLNNLHYPFLGMVVLTMLVWLTMYVRRVGYMQKNRISPEKAKTPEQMQGLVPEYVQNPSNNFKNLFEMPIIFYVLCLFHFIQQDIPNLITVSAYVFLLARIAHSFIHCTYNKVMHRFIAYVVGSLSIWVMVIGTLVFY